MRIGILTGGGDVPGLNACIRSVMLSADDLGWSVLGFRRGWEGVMGIEPDDPSSIAAHTVPLDREAVRGIDRTGGTILHTSRTDPRTHRSGDRTAHVLHVLDRLGVDAMVTLGGDGTLRFSAHLAEQGMKVISVPKTMDNDVFGTDYCIGFSTAVSRSVEAINALRTTVGSHERIGVVELFGRRSGETALLAGYLAQVDRTIISEVPADLDRLLPLLAEDKASNPSNYAMCVISEGAAIAGEQAGEGEIGKPGAERRELGVGQRLGRAIAERLGSGVVNQELAYLMRAGEPDAMDRMVGFAFGALAVQLLQQGLEGQMVCLSGGNYDHVPIGTLLTGTKIVDVEALYDPERYRARLLRVQGMPMFLY
jgi:6-phosphofructokinase